MKKRGIILSFALIGMLSIALSACGKENVSTDNDTQIEESHDNNTAEVIDTGSETKADENAESDVSEYTKAYQDFLAGNGSVYFDSFFGASNLQTPMWGYGELYYAFYDDIPYTFNDISKNLSLGISSFFGTKGAYPHGVSYAYIDCGQDKIPELALRFEQIGNEYDSANIILVVKLIDGKLQCIFQDVSAYRGNSTLNMYGYCTTYDAVSAGWNSSRYSCIDADGQTHFLYDLSDYTGVNSFYLPENPNYAAVAEAAGINDNIEIEQYSFEYYDMNQNYSDYLNNCFYMYYPLNSNYNRLEGDKLDEALKNGSYQRFWQSTGLKLTTQEELDAKLKEVFEKVGVNYSTRYGEEAEWVALTEAQLKTTLEWTSEYVSEPIVLEQPQWTYYYAGFEPEPTTRLTISEKSKTPNEIIHEYLWFEKLGLVQPDRFVMNDNNYKYTLYGEDPTGLPWYPYLMDINDAKTGKIVSTLDFTNYYKPDEINVGDEAFVEESLHWAVAEDGILYVSTYHMTYASSAPHNGYITALDMNDGYKVLWRSEPLVINSNNFLLTDDAIICGYGFTDEPDYIYILDKGCGVKTQSYKVKTSPEWFVMKDNTLYVRCYDTDYEFEIK